MMTATPARNTALSPCPRVGWEHVHANAPLLAATISDYLDQIAVSLRPNSVIAANENLLRFATFLTIDRHDITAVRDIARRHIEAFKIDLATTPTRIGTPPKSATIRRCLSAVRMFFLRIIEWDWPDAPARTPMFMGDLPKEDEPLPRFLDDGEFTRIMRAIAADTDPLRRLALELLARTGMRASELCALEHDAMVRIGDTHWLRIPIGKLHNDRYVPLHPHVVELIDTWHAHAPANTTGRLLTKNGQPISRHVLTRMCNVIARRSGVAHLHPHRFRHTLATQAINRGMSLDAIAALLGHRSLDMTRRYARIANKTVAAEYARVTADVEALYDTPLDADTEGPTMRLLRAEHHRLLANGVCTRPAQLDCRYESICETCAHFNTGLEFHPILIRQRDHARDHNQPQRAELFDELLRGPLTKPPG
jgi:site-specific recombinase XerD